MVPRIGVLPSASRGCCGYFLGSTDPGPAGRSRAGESYPVHDRAGPGASWARLAVSVARGLAGGTLRRGPRHAGHGIPRRQLLCAAQAGDSAAAGSSERDRPVYRRGQLHPPRRVGPCGRETPKAGPVVEMLRRRIDPAGKAIVPAGSGSDCPIDRDRADRGAAGPVHRGRPLRACRPGARRAAQHEDPGAGLAGRLAGAVRSAAGDGHPDPGPPRPIRRSRCRWTSRGLTAQAVPGRRVDQPRRKPGSFARGRPRGAAASMAWRSSSNRPRSISSSGPASTRTATSCVKPSKSSWNCSPPPDCTARQVLPSVRSDPSRVRLNYSILQGVLMYNRFIGVLFVVPTLCLASWCSAQEKPGDKVVKGSSFGFDPVDSTRALQGGDQLGRGQGDRRSAKGALDCRADRPWRATRRSSSRKGWKCWPRKDRSRGRAIRFFLAARKEKHHF